MMARLLLSPAELRLRVDEFIKEYSGKYQDEKEDNGRILSTVGKLLEIESKRTEVHENLILFSHIKQQKLYIVLDENKDLNKEKMNEADRFIENDRIIFTKDAIEDGSILYKLTGWRQVAFFPLLASFLLFTYARIKNRTSDKDLPLSKTCIENVLLDELWIAVNAFRIKNAYEGICLAQPFQEEKLTQFISTLIQEIHSLPAVSKFEGNETICFPCGVPTHAIYLQFVFYKEGNNDKGKYLLRMDNVGKFSDYHNPDPPSKDNPKKTIKALTMGKFKIKDKPDSNSLEEYLKRLCLAACQSTKSKEQESDQIRKIYNRGRGPHRLALSGTEGAVDVPWPALPEQEAQTCVVENYKIGMQYRMYGFGYQEKEGDLFKWLIDRFAEYASIEHLAELPRKGNPFENLINIQKKRMGFGVHETLEFKTAIQLSNDLSSKAQEILKKSYLGFNEIRGLFGKPFQLEGQYINLQMLYQIAFKGNKDSNDKKGDGKEDEEAKNKNNKTKSPKFEDARISSFENLFGDKRSIKPEDLFKPAKELFPDKDISQREADKIPNFLLIQGRAGIGKTTFVHYCVREWANHTKEQSGAYTKLFGQFDWVFSLSLRQLLTPLFQGQTLSVKGPLNLWQWIYYAQFMQSNLEERQFKTVWDDHIEPAIKQGKVLIILDGYDEIPEHHICEEALCSLGLMTKKEVAEVGPLYVAIPKIITSRPYGVSLLPQERRDIEVIGFTDENIECYAKTYFGEEKQDTVKALVNNLRERPAIWGTAHIPVNLNMICGITERALRKSATKEVGKGVDLSQLESMTELYQRMEHALYERAYELLPIAKTKPLEDDSELSWKQLAKHYQHERSFLAGLAFFAQSQGQIIIPHDDIHRLIRPLIEQEKVAHGKGFLQGVNQLGLIKPILDINLPEKEQSYEFIHLTFQEYYAAVYIAEHLFSQETNKKQKIEVLILEERLNPRWQIVWWFVAGLLKNEANPFERYLELLQGSFYPVTQKEVKQSLATDLFRHYELGLLARCIDEGETPKTAVCTLPLYQRIQTALFSFYQFCTHGLLSDNRYDLFRSNFLTSIRLSSRLRKKEGVADLYEKVPIKDTEDKTAFLQFVAISGLETPKSKIIFLGGGWNTFTLNGGGLGAQATDKMLRGDELGEVCIDEAVVRAVEGISSSIAATPLIIERLNKLLADKDKYVFLTKKMTCKNQDFHYAKASRIPITKFSVIAAGLLLEETARVLVGISDVVTSLFLECLGNLLTDEDWHIRYLAASVIGKIGSTAATSLILEQLGNLLADRDCDVREEAIDAIKKIGSSALSPVLFKRLSKLLEEKDLDSYNGIIRALRELIPLVFIPQLYDWVVSSNQVIDVNIDFYMLAALFVGAYFSTNISMQVYWHPEDKQYLVQGFVGKEKYQFPINSKQAQIIRRLIPSIIERLGIVEKLAITQELETTEKLETSLTIINKKYQSIEESKVSSFGISNKEYKSFTKSQQAQIMRRFNPGIKQLKTTMGRLDIGLLNFQATTWPRLEEDPILADSRMSQVLKPTEMEEKMASLLPVPFTSNLCSSLVNPLTSTTASLASSGSSVSRAEYQSDSQAISVSLIGNFSENNPNKLIKEMAKRISKKIEKNIIQKFKADWDKLDKIGKGKLLNSVEAGLNEKLQEQGCLSYLTKLTDSKDKCAEAIAEVIITNCHELERLEIDNVDIQDGIEKFKAAQTSSSLDKILTLC